MKEALHRVFSYKIVKPCVKKFTGRVDGYWSDHCNYGGVDLLHQATNRENPKAAITFYMEQDTKSLLGVDNPGREDYISGHPKKLSDRPPFLPINLDMVTSIEQTANGYLRHQSGGSSKVSLGHIFMPFSRHSMEQNKIPSGVERLNAPAMDEPRPRDRWGMDMERVP